MVRFDCIFKIHLEVVEGSRNEKHNADETSRGADGDLGHTQSFRKSVAGAESSRITSGLIFS